MISPLAAAGIMCFRRRTSAYVTITIYHFKLFSRLAGAVVVGKANCQELASSFVKMVRVKNLLIRRPEPTGEFSDTS